MTGSFMVHLNWGIGNPATWPARILIILHICTVSVNDGSWQSLTESSNMTSEDFHSPAYLTQSQLMTVPDKVWRSLAKWLNNLWNVRIFLSGPMKFYLTWSGSPTGFIKTVFWSGSSLGALWVAKDPVLFHMDSKDRRPIWGFGECTWLILLLPKFQPGIVALHNRTSNWSWICFSCPSEFQLALYTMTLLYVH